jgi:hypothetical protein
MNKLNETIQADRAAVDKKVQLIECAKYILFQTHQKHPAPWRKISRSRSFPKASAA